MLARKSPRQNIITTLKAEGVYLALGSAKALSIIEVLGRSKLCPQDFVDVWRVYAANHSLPVNKPMDESVLNK